MKYGVTQKALTVAAAVGVMIGGLGVNPAIATPPAATAEVTDVTPYLLVTHHGYYQDWFSTLEKCNNRGWAMINVEHYPYMVSWTYYRSPGLSKWSMDLHQNI